MCGEEVKRDPKLNIQANWINSSSADQRVSLSVFSTSMLMMSISFISSSVPKGYPHNVA